MSPPFSKEEEGRWRPPPISYDHEATAASATESGAGFREGEEAAVEMCVHGP